MVESFGCATNGKCVYADGFDTYLRENIQTAQAIIIAFTIKDHSMGSRFKMYDDRQFCAIQGINGILQMRHYGDRNKVPHTK